MLVLKRLALVVSASLFSTAVSAATLLDFTADNSSFTWYGNSSGCGSGCNLGYQFTLDSTTTFDGLGLYDADSDGLNDSHEVGVWDLGGNLLASTTVGPGTSSAEASASGAGSFVYETISNLVLGAGSYVIGAFYAVGTTDAVVFNASGVFSNVAGASYDGLRYSNTGLFGEPTNTGYEGGRYFGPNLRVADVPVPASLLLIPTGFIGFAALRRRKRKHA